MVTPAQLSRRSALFDQLGATIAAGVTLTKALEMAGKSRSVGIPRKVLQDITEHLKEGHTFTDAMQMASGQKRGLDVSLKRLHREYWLPEFDVALLSAGEESGRLDATFRVLARYYGSRAQLIRDTINSLIITTITFLVFLLVFPISYLQMFALGIINGEYGMCLPFLVEKTLALGAFFTFIWFLAFAGQGNRGEGFRAVLELLFSWVPMLGTALKYLAVARFAMALDALLNSGVNVIQAWELAVAATGSPKLKKEILKWAPELETGTTPAEIVARVDYFPEMFQQLYHTGEISGQLDETLTRLHTYFEEEGIRKLRLFSRILGIVIYLAIALLVAINVIHFYWKHYGDLLNI